MAWRECQSACDLISPLVSLFGMRLRPYLSSQLEFCTRIHTMLLLNQLSATKTTKKNYLQTTDSKEASNESS